MKERRKYERFPLTLPARMEMMTSGRKQIYEFQTRDISAGGAFINTKEQFSENTKFELNLTAQSDTIKKLTGTQSLIEVEGSIIRSTPLGVAIRFDGKCRILGLRGV